jgi:hypothetical protein
MDHNISCSDEVPPLEEFKCASQGLCMILYVDDLSKLEEMPLLEKILFHTYCTGNGIKYIHELPKDSAFKGQPLPHPLDNISVVYPY